MSEEHGIFGIFVGFLLVTLIAWLLITFALEMGDSYDKDTTELSAGGLNISEFEDAIDTIDVQTENYREQFESGEVEDVDDASGIFSITSNIISVIVAPFKLLSSILTNLFHVPPIAIGVFAGIVGLSLIYFGWRLVRRGD